MTRTVVAWVMVAVGAGALHPVLDACGDKSLSAGGIRTQRALAAKYPANILIYAQPNSRTTAAVRELKLQRSLQEVGYSYREVTSLSDAEAALASGRFNIVMADLADGAELLQRLQSSPARPVVVPIAYKLTKTEATQATKQYRFVVKAPSLSAQYLSTIADAVRSRTATPQ
jgi:CheY-like chemotaxis protein